MYWTDSLFFLKSRFYWPKLIDWKWVLTRPRTRFFYYCAAFFFLGIHLPSIYSSARMHVPFTYLGIVAFNWEVAWSVQHIYIVNDCLSLVITRWSRVHHHYTFVASPHAPPIVFSRTNCVLGFLSKTYLHTQNWIFGCIFAVLLNSPQLYIFFGFTYRSAMHSYQGIFQEAF